MSPQPKERHIRCDTAKTAISLARASWVKGQSGNPGRDRLYNRNAKAT